MSNTVPPYRRNADIAGLTVVEVGRFSATSLAKLLIVFSNVSYKYPAAKNCPSSNEKPLA